jgi:hypothetical protein
MDVYVRDSKGQRFTVRCEHDDDVATLIHRYTALCNESIDSNAFKYVLRYAGKVREESDLLTDLGISHESTVTMDVQKRKVEFKTVDYDTLLDTHIYMGWGTQKPLIPTLLDRICMITFLPNNEKSEVLLRITSFEELVPICLAIIEDWVTALRDIYDDSKEINDFIKKEHPEIKMRDIIELRRELKGDKNRLLKMMRCQDRGRTMEYGQGLLYPFDIVDKLMGKEINNGWEIVHIDKVTRSTRPVVIFKRVI